MRPKGTLRKNWLLILILTFCVGLVVLTFFKFLLPQMAVIREAWGAVEVKEKNLASLTRKATELELLEEKTLQDNLNKVNRALPFEKDVITPLVNLKVLAGQNAISLGKIELSPGLISTPEGQAPKSQPGSNFPSVSFKLRAEGSLGSLLSFLTDIKKTAPTLGIKTLNLTGKGGSYQGDLGIEVFWYSSPPSIGKISDPLPTLSSQDQETLAKISQLVSYPAFLVSGPEATQSPRVRTSLFD